MRESLKEHTRWRTLVSYWAWILTASVSIGSALRASGQFWAAAVFFAVAGLSAIAKSVQVAVDAKEDKLSHRLAYAAGYSLVAIVVSGLVIWGIYPVSSPVSPSAGDNASAAQQARPADQTAESADDQKSKTTRSTKSENPATPPDPRSQPATKPGSRERMPPPQERPAESPAVAAKPSLFLDCRMGTLPKTVPPSGRIYALVPQPLPEERGGGGLLEYFGQAGSEWKWERQVEFVYRCELTNYANSLLVDLKMDFYYEMRRPIPVTDQPGALKEGETTLRRKWPIIIAKIDVGTSDPFVFYLHNCCQDRFVYFRAPATARAMIVGQETELTVQQSQYNLNQPLNPTSLGEEK